MSELPSRRLLLVHAHPDDETIGNGATMAKYAAEGAQVTLVTCTLGEEGEVLVEDLAHIAADQQDELGAHREKELADAMALLGVTDHRLLGGAGSYRDSGMMGTASNERPSSFWRADLLEVASHLVAVIREVRPQVVIAYDDFGGYGHPDHIQAHRVATYAVALAAAPSFRVDLGEAWDVPKVYWTAFPRSWLQRGIDAMKAAGDTSFFEVDSADDLPMGVDDSLVTAAIDGREYEPRKLDAMRAHATQITVDGPFFALSNNIGQQAWAWEFYRLVKGTPAAPYDENGRETDLFAGVA